MIEFFSKLKLHYKNGCTINLSKIARKKMNGLAIVTKKNAPHMTEIGC